MPLAVRSKPIAIVGVTLSRSFWLHAFRLLIACLGLAREANAKTPDEVFEIIRNDALTSAMRGCKEYQDALVQVFCANRLRVGVRSGYGRFSDRVAGTLHGYEVDLGRVLAERLGVPVEFVVVTPADRLSAVAEGRVDVLLATTGHTTSRDTQVRFIRPHYYRSSTIVVGRIGLQIGSLDDLGGSAVCVTVGNWSNDALASKNVRLLLMKTPRDLLEALRSDICTRVAQDDVILEPTIATDPELSTRVTPYVGFASVPWGMSVRPVESTELQTALSLLMQILHRDGVLIALAEKTGVDSSFLTEQQTIWKTPACDTATGWQDQHCVLPPADTTFPATSFAPHVAQFRTWFMALSGISLSLPMFETKVAFDLLCNGFRVTLILLVGSVTATLVFGLGFAAMIIAPQPWLRLLGQVLVGVLRGAPLLLLVIFVSAVFRLLTAPSSPISILASVVAIGLYNGGFSGHAIADRFLMLRASGNASFNGAIRCAGPELTAFLVNAAKGIPNASVVGVPDLVNALTDIASVSIEHDTVFILLLVFYVLMVSAVYWFGTRLQWILRKAAA